MSDSCDIFFFCPWSNSSPLCPLKLGHRSMYNGPFCVLGFRIFTRDHTFHVIKLFWKCYPVTDELFSYLLNRNKVFTE